VFFAIKYIKILTLAKQEYISAKNVVKGIIFAFKHQQDKQTKSINRVFFKVNVVQSNLEKISKRIKSIEEDFVLVKTSQEPPLKKHDEITDQITSLKNELKGIIKDQSNIRDRVLSLETPSHSLKRSDKKTLFPESLRLTNLTETERSVLQLIIKKEAKTSSDVEQKISKTREHTARLLKKLWQEGYIERDTHRIPYIYRIPEHLKKEVSKKIDR
jgi:predicted transcriptional regulator